MWFATGVSPRPLTFLLYINDFHKSSKLFEFHLFADDVNIFLSDCNLHTLELKLIEELVKYIRTWLFADKLSVSIEKTNFVLFRAPQKKLKHNIILKMFN